MTAVEAAIIGAGPAGIAAAIQLKRFGFEPLLLEKDTVGGLLRNANLVENYPGFPNGISGPDLVKLFARQLDVTGVAVNCENVECVSADACGGYEIQTDSRVVSARLLVVASGTKPKVMTQPCVPETLCDRVLAEVYPLFDVAGKQIAIIGGGDAAFDYALNLARNNSVTIINRSGSVKCLPLLWSRCECCESIRYMADTSAVEISECGGRIRIECSGQQDAGFIDVDYLLTAIGREPQLDFLPGELKQANVHDSLYMIGDAANGSFRQVSIAVGDGVRAAMDIYRRSRKTI